MNHLSNFLKNGGNPEELFLDITYHPTLPLRIYNYSIESPKTHPVVMDARSAVLDADHNVIAPGFRRFFNLNECEELHRDFDWNNFSCVEKVDGSFIQVFYYNDEWIVCTRSTFGTGKVHDLDFTFADLFWRNISKYRLNHVRVYMFELVGPYNRVVRDYVEGLYLIGSWRYGSIGDIDMHESNLDIIAKDLGVNRPQYYTCKSMEDVANLLDEKSKSDPTFEGVVLRDNKMRIKCKSLSYLMLHRAANNGNIINKKSVVDLFIKGDLDEMIAAFPQFAEIMTHRKNKILQFLVEADTFYDTIKELNQKDFALSAVQTPYRALLFQMRRYNVPARTACQRLSKVLEDLL